jgi:hypothetical protein
MGKSGQFEISLDYQSIVSKLNSCRQSGGVARMLDVVGDMSKESSAWLQLVDIRERFINPQVRRMFSKAQAVKHKRV